MSIAFVQARNYTVGRIEPIRFVVIHDMEYPERLDTAEKVAAWFAGPTSPKASTHYNIDADSVVQSVKDKDTAWCAPGANADGLHFEHAGYARQTTAEWLDGYGKQMLNRSAALVAAKCLEHRIPPVRRTSLDILSNRPGIVGHADVSRAYPDKGSHTDPGVNFPWDYYLRLVAKHYLALTQPTPIPLATKESLVFLVQIKGLDPVYKSSGFARMHIGRKQLAALLKSGIRVVQLADQAELDAYGPEVDNPAGVK